MLLTCEVIWCRIWLNYLPSPHLFLSTPRTGIESLKQHVLGQWRSHGRAGHSKKYTHHHGLTEYPCLLPQGSPALQSWQAGFWIKMIPASGVCSRTGSCAGQTGLGDPSLKATTQQQCGWDAVEYSSSSLTFVSPLW